MCAGSAAVTIRRDLGGWPIRPMCSSPRRDSEVKSGAGLPIQNDMRAGPNPDQPLSADEARSWARIEAALRDDVRVSRWNPGIGLRDEGALSIGLLLVGIGAIVAGLAALPARTILIVGLTVISGGVGVALATLVLRRLVPSVQRRRALAAGRRTSRGRLAGLVIWRRAPRPGAAGANHERRVDS